MITVWADADEFWPWFELRDTDSSVGDKIEVNEETLNRWRKALAEANKAQEEIAEAVGWNR